MPQISDLFYFGYSKKVNGKNLELVIQTDVDELNKYKKLHLVYLEINKTLTPFKIASVRIIQHDEVALRFSAVYTPQQLKELTGKSCYLPLELLPPIETSSGFYHHEIIGFDVIDEKEGNIGKVKEIISASAQDILCVQHPKAEILIPLVDNFILKLDRNNHTLYIHAPDGLISLYLEDKKARDDEE